MQLFLHIPFPDTHVIFNHFILTATALRKYRMTQQLLFLHILTFNVVFQDFIGSLPQFSFRTIHAGDFRMVVPSGKSIVIAGKQNLIRHAVAYVLKLIKGSQGHLIICRHYRIREFQIGMAKMFYRILSTFRMIISVKDPFLFQWQSIV